MAKMSWAYIAGFFDGEGSAGLVRNGDSGNSRFYVSISQSKNNGGLELLEEIREFLVGQGVTIKSVTKNCSGTRTGNTQFNLQINKLDSIRKFLEGTFPYLRVKKAVAQDCLRYLKLYPSLIPYRHEIKKTMGRWSKPLTEQLIIEAKILHALKGTPYTKLAANIGVPTTTLRAACTGQNWKHLQPFIGDNGAYAASY